MTIKNLDAYVSALWDWGFLDDCFMPTRIRVTDVDGLVERNGRFLLLEGKRHNVEIPVGQKIMFRSLVQSGWTIIVIWGEANKPEAACVWDTPNSSGRTIENATLDDIKMEVSRWFEKANAAKTA